MVPSWLTGLSWAMLGLGVASCLGIAADVRRHPQKMWIMGIVWPLTGLYASVLALWFYRRYGRAGGADAPFAVIVARGATHCGAGCTLGDILAEALVLAAPGVLAAFGYPALVAEPIFAQWGLDYVVAFGLGVAFQYFTIAPMRGLGLARGIVVAARVDFFSLTAWQVGMYGVMGLAQFWVFERLLGARLEATTPEFWFVMQIAMLAGFATAYPVNWILIRRGVKEAM